MASKKQPAKVTKPAASTKTPKKAPVQRKRKPGEPTRPRPTHKRVAAKKTAKVAQSVSHPAEVAMTDKQRRFCVEYMADMNATQAAIRAGYSEGSARQIGSENLSKPYIQVEIARLRSEQDDRTLITADRVLQEAWHIVTADARDLVEMRVYPCRYCHSTNGRRQASPSEREEAEAQHILVHGTADEFQPRDGGLYSPAREINPECAECAGAGEARAVFRDTRALGQSAASLYAGAKVGKFGTEMQMHDKGAAMEKLFKHLGLYEKDNQQRVDPLASLLHGIASGNSNGFRPVADDPEHADPVQDSAINPVAAPSEDED